MNDAISNKVRKQEKAVYNKMNVVEEEAMDVEEPASMIAEKG